VEEEGYGRYGSRNKIHKQSALLRKGTEDGYFSGSGVGKSVLLGMMAKNTRADVNVIGLIGEERAGGSGVPGKEISVRKVLDRSVVVVATSDTHPIIRMRAALRGHIDCRVFRDQG